jgi:hypothetical protein
LFKKIVQEVFNFKEDSKLSIVNQLGTNNSNILEKLISEKASIEYGLFANKNWVEKCMQIYYASNTFKGNKNYKIS